MPPRVLVALLPILPLPILPLPMLSLLACGPPQPSHNGSVEAIELANAA